MMFTDTVPTDNIIITFQRSHTIFKISESPRLQLPLESELKRLEQPKIRIHIAGKVPASLS